MNDAHRCHSLDVEAAGRLSAISHLPWVLLRAPPTDHGVWEALSNIGDLLGPRVAGREGAREEVVVPRVAQQAYLRSLSATYGLGALPLHVELSHRPRPCRYVLLGCLGAGELSIPTTLLDRQTLAFTEQELAILSGAPLLIRTGRRSFYSTALPRQGDYLRYDPGCMEAVDDRGREALRLMEFRLAEREPVRHQWTAGDILVIDNWRTLHGRAPALKSAGRRLARILIDG